MANSVFWRNLASEFRTLDPVGIVSARWTSVAGRPTQWRLIGTVLLVTEFESLARRGAFELAQSEYSDLLIAWLEALRQAALFDPSYISPEPDDNDDPPHITDTIKAVCTVSASYCRLLESLALQSEFEEKQRNDPRNWSPLRQDYEAFKSIKKLITGAHEEIPEDFVRESLARHHGIKPEEVTPKQINFEVAGLLREYPDIKLIPSKPSAPAGTQQEPSNPPQAPSGDAEPIPSGP
jgi:hypothetical protein